MAPTPRRHVGQEPSLGVWTATSMNLTGNVIIYQPNKILPAKNIAIRAWVEDFTMPVPRAGKKTQWAAHIQMHISTIDNKYEYEYIVTKIIYHEYVSMEIKQ